MRRRLLVLGVLMTLFAFALAAPASATTPLDVDIDVRVVIPADGPPSGTFEATGPAVAAGLLCAEGTHRTLLEKFAGSSDVVVNATVITEFTCTDAPFAGDTFITKAQLHADLTSGPPTWVLRWVVKGGTGAFADLHGSGSGTGGYVSAIPLTILDQYTGGLH